MTAVRLVLFAHGSPDPRWRAPFERLASEISADVGEERVGLAWMESARPTLEEAGDEAAASGIDLLRILPLFMASGIHVHRDIEARAETVRASHPGLAVEILPPVGEDPRLVAALREIALDAAQRP